MVQITSHKLMQHIEANTVLLCIVRHSFVLPLRLILHFLSLLLLVCILHFPLVGWRVLNVFCRQSYVILSHLWQKCFFSNSRKCSRPRGKSAQWLCTYLFIHDWLLFGRALLIADNASWDMYALHKHWGPNRAFCCFPEDILYAVLFRAMVSIYD
jgi:hypothetical protein